MIEWLSNTATCELLDEIELVIGTGINQHL